MNMVLESTPFQLGSVGSLWEKAILQNPPHPSKSFRNFLFLWTSAYTTPKKMGTFYFIPYCAGIGRQSSLHDKWDPNLDSYNWNKQFEERKIMVHGHLSTSVYSAQIFLTAHLWFSSAYHTSATSKPANQPFTRYHFVAQIHVLKEFHNLWLSVGVRYGGVTNTMQWCGCCN
jgi:hypothetical protein